jgi:hypothetical protein
MKTSFALLFSIFTVFISGCDKKQELPAPETPPSKTPGGSKGNLATAPVDYLAAAGKAEQSMEKQIDTAALDNALQLFAVQEGRIPETLDELVEKKYLSKLPTPPFGSKLHYDKDAGKVTVVKE